MVAALNILSDGFLDTGGVASINIASRGLLDGTPEGPRSFGSVETFRHEWYPKERLRKRQLLDEDELLLELMPWMLQESLCR